MEASASARYGWWRTIGLVVGAGLATGAITQLGQAWLPDGLTQWANAISPWLLVAFLVGSIMPDNILAAIAGATTLVLALVAYNVMLHLQVGYSSSVSATLFWVIGAAAGGPVFGIAGRAWRIGTPKQRAVALGLLVALFVAEGARNAVQLSYPIVGAMFIITGLLLPLILGRTREVVGWAYAAAVPMLGLSVLGYLAFTGLYGLITGT